MGRFHIVLALLVALATSTALRAATHHWRGASPHGRWAGQPAGFFKPGLRHWGRPGCWGEPAAPGRPGPLAPAPSAPTPAAPPQ